MAALNPQTPAVRLPHPYLTSYSLHPAANPHSFSLLLANNQLPASSLPPLPLHNDAISFTLPSASPDAPTDNTPFARARRSLHTTISWATPDVPIAAQLWLLTYALFTTYHSQESLRITLSGASADKLKTALLASHLALPHPLPTTPANPIPDTTYSTPELLLSRSTFWQGAGSPFGHRAAWVAHPSAQMGLTPPVTEYTFTTKFPAARVHAKHPVRPAKPPPGSTVYSRWLPHLDEYFTMRVVDWRSAEDVRLFNKWQNDPHVAAGWHQEGPLEEHRQYLQDCEEDPKTLSVLGCFDGVPFGYFEMYWAKEDHMGAHYDAGDWDRGRHLLVGNMKYRGPHRVSVWWACVLHFLFLDDARTMRLVGEPNVENKVVAKYEALNGCWSEGYIDLAHKRATKSMISREKFFVQSPLHYGEERGVEGERVVAEKAKL